MILSLDLAGMRIIIGLICVMIMQLRELLSNVN